MASVAKQLEWQSGWNQVEQQQAFDLNMQATRDERAYNQPVNQLARLRAAGLNPLYYGLDGNSSNGAPFQTDSQRVDVPAAFQAEQARQANLIASIDQVLQASKQMAEVKQIDAQTELLHQQSKQSSTETRLNEIRADWLPVQNGMELKIGESTVKLNISQSDVNSERVKEIENLVKRNDIINENIKAQTKVYESQVPLNMAQAAAANSVVGLNEAQAENARSQAVFYRQHTETEKALTGVAFEHWAQEQIKTGALPEQISRDLGLKKVEVDKIVADTDNIKKLSKVYENQALKVHEELLIDGARVGIWKMDNGKLAFDYAKVYDESKAAYIENTIGVYLKMYEDYQNTQANSANATANVISSIIPWKISAGTSSPIQATKSYVSPRMSKSYISQPWN